MKLIRVLRGVSACTLGVAAGMVLTGCDRDADDGHVHGPGDTNHYHTTTNSAERAAEEAAASLKEAARDTGTAIKEGAKDAASGIGRGLEKAGEELQKAGAK